jgi:non-heme dioxygenase-like protein
MLVYSAPQTVERIPIVDLGGGTSAMRTAQQIHEACRDIGFFYVINHGVPETLLTEQLSCAARFFELPAAPLDQRPLSVDAAPGAEQSQRPRPLFSGDLLQSRP